MTDRFRSECKAPLAQGEGAEVKVITRPHTTDAPISSFVCPGCGSVYKVGRLKTLPEPHDHPVGCLTCGRALAPREEEFLLKYSGLRDAESLHDTPLHTKTGGMSRHSPQQADCGNSPVSRLRFVGIISRATEDDCGEFTYRCEKCQFALERNAKSCTSTAAGRRAFERHGRATYGPPQ
jgi:predicted RNA-binding Zn-ribbon protein involved in translation (DUF1610 family)